MVIKAAGEAAAHIAEAEGSLEAAIKLGNDPLTITLERIRRANEVLSRSDKVSQGYACWL